MQVTSGHLDNKSVATKRISSLGSGPQRSVAISSQVPVEMTATLSAMVMGERPPVGKDNTLRRKHQRLCPFVPTTCSLLF